MDHKTWIKNWVACLGIRVDLGCAWTLMHCQASKLPSTLELLMLVSGAKKLVYNKPLFKRLVWMKIGVLRKTFVCFVYTLPDFIFFSFPTQSYHAPC